jgi:hypothetical protein
MVLPAPGTTIRPIPFAKTSGVLLTTGLDSLLRRQIAVRAGIFALDQADRGGHF